MRTVTERLAHLRRKWKARHPRQPEHRRGRVGRRSAQSGKPVPEGRHGSVHRETRGPERPCILDENEVRPDIGPVPSSACGTCTVYLPAGRLISKRRRHWRTRGSTPKTSTPPRGTLPHEPEIGMRGSFLIGRAKRSARRARAVRNAAEHPRPLRTTRTGVPNGGTFLPPGTPERAIRPREGGLPNGS